MNDMNQGLSQRVQALMGPKGVFDFGIFAFTYLNGENGQEEIAWVTVEDPSVGQMMGLLECVKQAIYHNALIDIDEDEDGDSSTAYAS